ncbi:hypothetical protein BH11MYX4_BH11MYX4_44050 [soil metagenome]
MTLPLRVCLLSVVTALASGACSNAEDPSEETSSATTTLRVGPGVPAPLLCSHLRSVGCAPAESRLLIVGADILYGTMDKLRNHKNATGMSAYVMTMSDVRQYPGRDDAERLKHVIRRMHEEKGTWYVLLAGGGTDVPVRRRSVMDHPGSENYNFDSGYNISDLYYANLYHHVGLRAGTFDDWDASGNGRFNEQMWEDRAASNNPDDVDGYPDVAVGRVPSVDGFGTYVDKVIRYETGTAGHPSGLTTAAFIADLNYPGATTLLERIENETHLAGRAQHWVVNSYDTPPPAGWSRTGEEAVAAIDTMVKTSPWISYVGHGSRGNWGVYEKGGATYGWDHVRELDNTYLPIVFAAACETGKFSGNAPLDPYTDVNGVNRYLTIDKPNGVVWVEGSQTWPLPFVTPVPGVYDHVSFNVSFASDFITPTRGGGAIAYFGMNVSMPPGLAVELQIDMLKSYGKGYRVLGDIYADGARTYWADNLSNDYVFGHPRIFLSIAQFFGDPSLRLK